MTRVILTNKQTGQTLPEAELVADESAYNYEVRFDGVNLNTNYFAKEYWNATIVRKFRNGDVLRRKDRNPKYAPAILVDGAWFMVFRNGETASFRLSEVQDKLTNPDWEVV